MAHLSSELYGEPAREGSGSSAAPSVISNMVRSVSCRAEVAGHLRDEFGHGE